MARRGDAQLVAVHLDAQQDVGETDDLGGENVQQASRMMARLLLSQVDMAICALLGL